MKLNKIGIIGHFCLKGNRMDGQTVKTRELNEFLEKYYGEATLKYDTYKNNRNPIKIIKKTYKIVKNSENVIIILSNRGYRVILPIVIFLNFFYKRKIFDFVIGGMRYKFFDKNKFLKNIASKVNKIYVETEKIKNEYEKRKIMNVEVIPNFKNTQVVTEDQIDKNYNKEILRFCTFSRVNKQKGIEDSIKAIKIANKKMNSDIFELDIYGEIDMEYKKEFAEILKDLPQYIRYKGCVDSKNAVKILKNYNVMLFLTYWKAEGFPRNID